MREATSAPTEPAEESSPEPKNFVAKLSDGTIVKSRVPRQRACNELTGKKGKICAGHLKRWYGYGDEIVRRFGNNPEVYRCERCDVLFRPNEHEVARTGTLAF